MADLQHVEEGLVAQVALSLFPDGSYQPGTALTSPVTGSVCNIYRGWPLEATLDIDLLNGVTHVSVFPSPGMARITTRYFRKYVALPQLEPGLTATVAGHVVTFAGVCSPDQVVGVGYGGNGFTYRMTSTDTPTSIAAKMATHFSGAVASGATLTLNTSSVVVAYVMADGTSILETRRQEQVLRVSIWAPDPLTRDAYANVIDPYLSDVRRLIFPDGSSSGPTWYRGSYTDDVPQKEHLWIRHLSYAVDYPTILSHTDPKYIFGGGNIEVELSDGQTATIGTYPVQLLP